MYEILHVLGSSLITEDCILASVNELLEESEVKLACGGVYGCCVDQCDEGRWEGYVQVFYEEFEFLIIREGESVDVSTTKLPFQRE